MKILNKILDQKWLITIVLLLLLGFMVISKQVTSEVFIPIITTIVGYYFGSASKSNVDGKADNLDK